MSNYPPGVSGFEPEIAGSPEGIWEVDCDHEIDGNRVEVVIDGDRERLFPLSASGQDEITCPFKGDLNMQVIGQEAVGDCPVCGNTIGLHLADERP